MTEHATANPTSVAESAAALPRHDCENGWHVIHWAALYSAGEYDCLDCNAAVTVRYPLSEEAED